MAQKRTKSIYSRKVLATVIDEPMKQAIISSEIGTDALKKVIAKEAQKANRRMQNVINAGLSSPAVKAVIAERGKQGYTYFSVKGFDANTRAGWERLKYEYGRIMSFLNNPTSSATGARQYIKYNADKMNVPFETANKIIDMATSPTIDQHGNINIFNYRAVLDQFRNDVFASGDAMDSTQADYENDLEQKLQEAINLLQTEQEAIYQKYIRSFLK